MSKENLDPASSKYNTSRLSRGDLVVYTGKWSKDASHTAVSRYGRYFVILDVEEKQWPGAIARVYDSEVQNCYYYAGDLEIIVPAGELGMELPAGPESLVREYSPAEEFWPEELVNELMTRWGSWDGE